MKSRLACLAAVVALSIGGISRAADAPVITQRIVAPIADEAPGLLGVYFKDTPTWADYQKAGRRARLSFALIVNGLRVSEDHR